MFIKLMSTEKYKDSTQKNKLNQNYEEFVESLSMLGKISPQVVKQYKKKVDEYLVLYSEECTLNQCHKLLEDFG